MNSELEKLIEKYRITVNGLADLESDYEKVIKERGFVTLNGLLVSGESAAVHSPSGEENAPVGENTPVADPAPVEPTPVVPAPSEGDSSHNEPAAQVPPTPTVPVDGTASNEENPGVTPVAPSDSVVEAGSASGERSADENSVENNSEEVSDGEEVASGEEPAAGGKPKKKKK